LNTLEVWIPLISDVHRQSSWTTSPRYPLVIIRASQLFDLYQVASSNSKILTLGSDKNRSKVIEEELEQFVHSLPMPSPPHAFSPFLNYYDETDSMVDIWKGTGLTGNAYFAARNNAIPLIVAAQTNNLASVQTLISKRVALDDKGLEGETALHMAAALGYIEIIEALIAAGASVDATDEEGSTPLIHCTRFCPLGAASQVASILLSAGADPAHMVIIDLCRHSPLWFAIQAHAEALVRLLEPLVPRELDVYPPETGRNHIIDAAISGADKSADTSILDYLIQKRSLPLRPSDLAKAVDNHTFSAIVRHLSLNKEGVMSIAVDTLSGVWALDRRRIAPSLQRLVEQYHLDVNEREVQRFVVTSGSIELVNTAVGLGMDLKSIPLEVIKDWLGRRNPQDLLNNVVLGLVSSP
ncbi:inversin protein alternative isoform, partial [Moniliophthora roreri]